MARSINSATLTAFGSDSFVIADLLTIDLSTPVYLTDSPHDVLYDSKTFQSSGHLLSMAEPSESRDLRVGSVTIGLSGVSQEYVSILLNQDWINRDLILEKVALNDDGTVVGSSVVIFQGQLSQFQILDNRSESKISLVAASHWADFEKTSGRTTNNNSQQFYFAGDLGMEYAANVVKDLKWGKA